MKNFTYNSNATFEEALTMLDQNGNGFLPVVDKDGKLYGVITDGDLRRGVLDKNLTLDAIINKNPIVEKTTTSEFDVKMKLKELHRRHMPIVDENGVLIRVVVLNNFEYVSKNNRVVIMCGGMGSRLGPLTKDIPKPMLLVGGKPILLEIIEYFKSQGFCKFILCVNYKSEVIEDYFQNGEKFGIDIKYTKEVKRLGTAGALSLIEEILVEPFFVVNGDVLSSVNYEHFLEFHNNNTAAGTMCIKSFSNEIPYACIEFNEHSDLLALKEKPSYDYFINTGMYILDPDVLKYIPNDVFFDMPSLFEILVDNKEITKVFTNEEYWLDIGNPSDYERGKKDFK